MEKYIDLLRVIIKNFNIDNNHEFDDVIKKILNKIFDEYYHNRNKSIYCLDNLYKKYDIRYIDLQRKYFIINNNKLIFKFNKLEVDDFQMILNKNLYIVYMENYILKHFNIRKNNEFDNIIKYVIKKIFDEYYNNRHKSIYCIDNLITRYSMRYFNLQIKYGTVKKLNYLSI